MTDERYLIFSLNKDPYAIWLSAVKEVIAYKATTPMPHSPAHFKGIINLREQVIPILDLRMKLKLAKAEINAETSILVLEFGQICVGAIVDSVDSVTTIPSTQVEPAPALQPGQKNSFLSGVAKVDDKLILILDIASALDVNDLKAVKSSLAPKAA